MITDNIPGWLGSCGIIIKDSKHTILRNYLHQGIIENMLRLKTMS
ncbi:MULTISPECIES: hypothetical protein [Francisella]|nr:MULTISPECIES: hypothetical protein [Francisella]APC92453.1 hypothetical protein BBG19_1731 [Francisella sp. MA067296]